MGDPVGEFVNSSSLVFEISGLFLAFFLFSAIDDSLGDIIVVVGSSNFSEESQGGGLGIGG